MNKYRISNKDIEIMKRSQIKILVLKSTITTMKNLLEEFNSRCEQVEERFSEFEDMTIKIIQSEEQKERILKKKRKKKQNLRDLCKSIKRTKIHIMRVQEERRGQKEYLMK